MKKGLTKIVFLVDRSGSMESVASDMIGGFNRFIKNQKENDVGECRVSFNQFDDIFEEVYKNVEIKDVVPLTAETFVPRNSTALYDAVGRTIDDVGKELASLPEDERPEKVQIIILTDGLENRSKVYTLEKIRDMIKTQSEVYNWVFTYIGANQDTWAVGQGIGIVGKCTYSFASSGANKSSSNQTLWDTLSTKVSNFRSASTIVAAAAAMAFSPKEQKEQEDLIKKNTP